MGWRGATDSSSSIMFTFLPQRPNKRRDFYVKSQVFFSNLIEFLFEEYMESVFELLPISDERVCFGQH